MTTEAPDLTVRERVDQAIARQFELIAERHASNEAVRDSDAARNVLRANNPETKEEAFLAAQVESIHKAEDAYTKQEAVIARPLARSQANYDSKELVMRGERDNAIGQALLDYDKLVEDTQREFDLAMAAAEAETYRAKEDVKAKESTIKQHAAQVKDSLGIDLNALAG